MKRTIAMVALALLAWTGCKQNDQVKVHDALNDHPFFQALGAVPAQSGDYTGGGKDGDTSWPIAAARKIRTPDIDYTIEVNRPLAEVSFQIVWPCTLAVVYTDIPDTAARDTVLKPAPKINGVMSWVFEHQGDSWRLQQLSPCKAKFDSVLEHVRIDSFRVKVRRAGETFDYPTMTDPAVRLPVDSYPYTFQAGDSVDLRLWETNDLGANGTVWAYLHSDPGSFTSGFHFDTLTTSFYGSWTVNHTGRHWVWFEAVDIEGAVFSKTGPDRSILWGLPYLVQ